MGHFYDQTGKPTYTVIAKGTGKPRDTTLADAKKLNLAPSSTGVAKVVAKEQVEKWKRDILLEVILKHNKLPEDELLQDVWTKDILALAKIEWERASSRGTELHDKLEEFYTTGKLCSEDEKYLLPTIKFLEERYPGVKWISEASFCHPSGYGGKVDLHSKDGKGIIVDFKTKAKDKLDKSLVYDDYCQQLASYRYGLELPDAECQNLIISTTLPQAPYQHIWKEEEVLKGYAKFNCLLAYWKLISNHDASRRENEL